MSPDEERRALEAQLKYLADELTRTQDMLPSTEELAYLRNIKLTSERSSWAWQQIRTYAPWVMSVTGTVGGAAYWFVTHFSWKGNPP